MPIYEYQCGACGRQLEILQKITEDPLKVCPECHQATLNKLVSSTSFQLKGTGWYATDFRDKGKPPKKSEGKEEKTELSKESSKEKDTKDSSMSSAKAKDTKSTNSNSSNDSTAG